VKSLQIVSGDLVLSPSGRARTVEGLDKLRQDLHLWLSEPLGIGYTTASFGTRLNDLMFGSNDELSRQNVQSEVLRVISVYKAWQGERLLQTQSLGLLSNWKKSEIIAQIVEVVATRVLTSIVVKVVLTTLAGETISVELQSGTQGIRVT